MVISLSVRALLLVYLSIISVMCDMALLLLSTALSIESVEFVDFAALLV